jgi:hypothetical protein
LTAAHAVPFPCPKISCIKDQFLLTKTDGKLNFYLTNEASIQIPKLSFVHRRVLRHCFVFLAKFGWKEDLVAKWSEICEKQVVSANSLNQTVTKKKKKRRKKQFENEENKTETENGTVDASGNLSADPVSQIVCCNLGIIMIVFF